jgi:hypothetical protein
MYIISNEVICIFTYVEREDIFIYRYVWFIYIYHLTLSIETHAVEVAGLVALTQPFGLFQSRAPTNPQYSGIGFEPGGV